MWAGGSGLGPRRGGCRSRGWPQGQQAGSGGSVSRSRLWACSPLGLVQAEPWTAPARSGPDGPCGFRFPRLPLTPQGTASREGCCLLRGSEWAPPCPGRSRESGRWPRFSAVSPGSHCSSVSPACPLLLTAQSCPACGRLLLGLAARNCPSGPSLVWPCVRLAGRRMGRGSLGPDSSPGPVGHEEGSRLRPAQPPGMVRSDEGALGNGLPPPRKVKLGAGLWGGSCPARGLELGEAGGES